MAPGPPQGKLGGPPQQAATKTPLPPTPNQALVQNTELTVRTHPPLVVPVRTQQAEGGPARAHRQRPSQRDQGDTNRPPPPELPQHLGNVHLGPGVPQHSTTQRSSTEDRTPPLSGCSNPRNSGVQPPSQPKEQICLYRQKRQAEHKEPGQSPHPPLLTRSHHHHHRTTPPPTLSDPQWPIPSPDHKANLRLARITDNLE